MRPPTQKQLGYIASLRRELGVKTERMPGSSREASRIISELRRRREARQRSELRREAAAASPSDEVRETILRLAGRLGVDVEVPATAADAQFVLDDLRHRERRSRRTADGTAG